MTEESPAVDNAAENVTELRLALVCYGGVSLAVYMHGVTKELHKLICAARAFDRDTEHNPFPGDDSEAVYFEALRRIGTSGTTLSVSIDIIGGTSAGGINGIALSKALACNVDMSPLKRVWLDDGDIRKLLRGYSKVPLPIQVGFTVVRQLVNLFGNSSPLKGEYMSKLLFTALTKMQKLPKLSTAPSLLPDVSAGLELYVPTTDLYGFDVRVASGAGGASNRDHDFRQVMVFSRDETTKDTFGAEYTADLAFAGRASSSFPGAFAPVSPGSFRDELKKTLPTVADSDTTIHAKSLFLRPYESSDAAPQLDETAMEKAAWTASKDVYFVDGGVLDNAPFDLVIDAIARREAQREVIRQLVYIEPDPGQALYAPLAGRKKSTRRWLKDLLAVSGVRGSHPILADLTRLRDLNWRINEVRTISEHQAERVAAETRDALAEVLRSKTDSPVAQSDLYGRSAIELVRSLDGEDLQRASDEIYARAEKSLEPVWHTYLLLRFEAVMKQLSGDICWTLHCPKPSNKAGFISAVWIEWARLQHWGEGAGLSTVLDATDMLYRQRRLLFIIDGINAMYKHGGAPRGDLDELKRAAWEIVGDIRTGTADAVGKLKGEGALTVFDISDDDAVRADPAQFAADHADALQAFFEKYQVALKPLAGDSERLREAFTTHTTGSDWTDDHKTTLVSRYLGFPLWDGMLFPTISLSAVPQFSPIPVAQFSPINATALTPPRDKNNKASAKLKGVSFKHFAAFFATESRQNDYLWGRLDGAELILRLLADVGELGKDGRKGQATTLATVGGGEQPPPPFAAEAFDAVLASEKDLELVTDLRADLQAQVASIARTGMLTKRFGIASRNALRQPHRQSQAPGAR